MTSPSPQVPVEKKKSNTTLIIVIVALLFLFVILPLCVILAIIAIIAVNPAGNRETTIPTPSEITIESIIPTTSTPTLVNPTIDPYIGWKTFENANLGISFKYPASFNVQESESAIQIYTEGSSGSRPLQITIHNEPFDKEFFASHNLRQEEHDRTIQIGNESFTTSYFSSVEGSPGSNPDEVWFTKWEDEIVEIGERTVIISTQVESIDNKNQEMAIIVNAPSLEDIDDAVLILKSMVLN